MQENTTISESGTETSSEACVEKVLVSVRPNSKISCQAAFYFFFAVLMIGLNELIQYLHLVYFIPFVQHNFGQYGLIQKYYLSTSPINMPLLIGQCIAVVITVIIKFILDKYYSFEKRETYCKIVTRQFTIYFIFAIITTVENLGIQFGLDQMNASLWTIWAIIALSCGYVTKFFLDRKYCFNCA